MDDNTLVQIYRRLDKLERKIQSLEFRASARDGQIEGYEALSWVESIRFSQLPAQLPIELVAPAYFMIRSIGIAVVDRLHMNRISSVRVRILNKLYLDTAPAPTRERGRVFHFPFRYPLLAKADAPAFIQVFGEGSVTGTLYARGDRLRPLV